jgi:hypothetical protein
MLVWLGKSGIRLGQRVSVLLSVGSSAKLGSAQVKTREWSRSKKRFDIAASQSFKSFRADMCSSAAYSTAFKKSALWVRRGYCLYVMVTLNTHGNDDANTELGRYV